MVQTPQVSSQPGLAPLTVSTGKALRKQTGNAESFASLLTGNSGDVAAAVPDSSVSSATAVQMAGAPLQGRNLSKGQQAKPAAQTSSGEPSSTADVAQTAGSQPVTNQYTPFPAGNSAFLQLSLRAMGSPDTTSAKQSPAAAGDANTSTAGAKAKSAKSEASPETVTPATLSGASASGSLALLAAQIQTVPNTQAAVQTQGGAETLTGSAATARTASRAGVNAAGAAVAEGQAVASKKALAAGQAQAANLGGTLAAETVSSAASGSQAVSGPPSNQTIESAASNLTVTDVRTHFAPEAQTGKSQALESAISDTASNLSAEFGAAGAASGAAQGSQPVSEAANSGSHPGHSGAETPTPAPADKQAVQSSEVSAAPAASLTSQTASSPMQQVFDAIQSAMPAAKGETAPAAGSPSVPADYQPLKTITIAFQPDNLGTVTMQLSLKSSQLGVRLDASDPSTAQLLRQHDGDLSDLLQSAGYVVGNIAIHAASQAAPADAQAQAGAGGQNASNTGGSGTGGGSQGTGSETQRQPGSRSGQREAPHGSAETPNSDGSLYV